MNFIGIMGISDYIAIAAIVIPTVITIIGGIYKTLTDTKKYELTEQYKRELLTWYGKNTYIISELLHLKENENYADDRKNKLLSDLSAQIEIGRFYFPNIDHGDKFGEEKQLAYRGYRHYVLDLLIWIYKELKEEEEPSKEDLEFWMREYTSIIFEIIDPKTRLKQIEKYTDL